MANEITLSCSLKSDRTASGSSTAVVVGSALAYGTLLDNDQGSRTQSFTTIAAVTTAGVTSPGYTFIKNTSTTGNLLLYLDVGATQRFATLHPGEAIGIPAPNSMWGAASTGTVEAHVVCAKA